MSRQQNIQTRLAKFIQKEHGINWDQYLERFKSYEPLELTPTAIYPSKLEIIKPSWSEDPFAIKSNTLNLKK